MCVTKEELEQAIEVAGSIQDAAQLLGISRSCAYKKAKEYELTDAKNRKRADFDEKKMVEEFNNGVAVTDIAKMLGVSATTIWRRIEEMQVKRTMEIEKRIDKKRCIEMLRNGSTNEEIATEFQCSATTIKRFLKKNNLRGYRKKKVTKSDVSELISELKARGEKVKFCENTAESKTMKSCLYGGRCGGYDCCDYLSMTGKRRKYDPENPQICHCFVHVKEAEKRKVEFEKAKNARDILVR